MTKRRVQLVAFAAGLTASPTALAQPKFTVAEGGPSGLEGRHVYRVVGGIPLVAWAGDGMGCIDPIDDVVAISARKTVTQFVACSSVDPTSVGQFQGAPPPGLPPYSVFDQRGKRQHAGDLWLISKAFDRVTGIVPGASIPLEQMYLAVNQAPSWTADFGLLPSGGPEVTFPPSTPMDDIDGVIREAGVPKVYFCLSSSSPSLDDLAGLPASGADIIFDPFPLSVGNEGVFAKAVDLGLLVGDQIDAIIIYDDGDDGVFDDVDTVIFSLGRGSPSLVPLGATAADLLVVNHGSEATPQIFATADNWGLGPNDNIDEIGANMLVGFSAYQTILQIIGDFTSKFTVNGPIESDLYKGFNLADASTVEPSIGLLSFGFGNGIFMDARVADDFVIPPSPDGQPALITGFTFLGYQPNSGTGPSPFQQYAVGIWSTKPFEGGQPDVMPYTPFDLFGPNKLSSNFPNIYRVSEDNMLDTTRPVFQNKCTLAQPLLLPPGEYWLDWQAAGNPSLSGPWVPPITLKGQQGKPGANAMQQAFGTWASLVDNGPSLALHDLPFKVHYQRESPPPNLCYADCDGDGTLSIDDFICYQTMFALNENYADCDGDGALSIDDFICYQTFFAIGCD